MAAVVPEARIPTRQTSDLNVRVIDISWQQRVSVRRRRRWGATDLEGRMIREVVSSGGLADDALAHRVQHDFRGAVQIELYPDDDSRRVVAIIRRSSS